MLTLSRRVPARTKTYRVLWCRADFMSMSQRFRAIRSKSRNRMDKCHICRHPFEDGEMMALGCFEVGGNKTLCQGCAAELLASEQELQKGES